MVSYVRPPGTPMTQEQLNKQVERTLKRNEAAIKRVRSRGQRLQRAAERSTLIVDRAVRQLRHGSAG
jgi:hypothetical protein